MPQKEQPHVDLLERLRKEEREPPQVLDTRSQVERPHVRLLPLERHLAHSSLELTFSTLAKQEQSECPEPEKKPKAWPELRCLPELQVASALLQLLAQLVPDLWVQCFSPWRHLALTRWSLAVVRLRKELDELPVEW